MLREDLFAERIAIEPCSEIARWIGDDDTTSRKMIEEILKAEEEHVPAREDAFASRCAYCRQFPDSFELCTALRKEQHSVLLGSVPAALFFGELIVASTLRTSHLRLQVAVSTI
jgi:hypothetical protein